MTDQSNDQTANAVDTIVQNDNSEASLEKLQKEIVELKKSNSNFEKGLTKATMENSDLRKQIDSMNTTTQVQVNPYNQPSIGTTPTNSNPYIPGTPQYQQWDIENAKHLLGLDKPLADVEYVNSAVNKTLDDRFSDYERRIQVNSFIDKYNASVSSEEAKFTSEERERAFELVKSGLNLEQVKMALKGDAILKEMQEKDKQFRSRQLSTANNQVNPGTLLSTGEKLSAKDLADPEKYDDEFNKIWDSTQRSVGNM